MRRVTRSRTTEQDWIEAGYDAVGHGGLANVSIERIAERLGVSKAGFYCRFADRQALLNAITEHWIVRGAVHFDRATEIEDPERQLRQVGYWTLADHQLRRADAWLLLHGLDDPELAERSRRIRDQTREWSLGLFRSLGFTEPDARIRSHLLYTGYLGLVADIEAQGTTPSDEELRVRVDQLIDLVTAPV